MKVYLSESFEVVLAKRGLKKQDVASNLSITAEHLSRLIHKKSGIGDETRKRVQVMFNGLAWDKLFKIDFGEQNEF